MPDAGRLASFALISFAIIVVPGPSVLFVISRGITLGRLTESTRSLERAFFALTGTASADVPAGQEMGAIR